MSNFSVSGWSGGAERVSEVTYSGPLAQGDIVCQISGSVWVKSTGANLIANNTFPAAIVLQVSTGSLATIQASGTAAAAITGLATFATSELVRLNTSTARMERLTVAPTSSDWLLGRAFPTGAALLTFSGVQGPTSGANASSYVIVNLTDYGGVGDNGQVGTATANTAAFRAAIADAATLGIDEIEVPGPNYSINDTICAWDDDNNGNLRHLRIVGERRAIMDPGRDAIVWHGGKNSGTTASLEGGLSGTADPNQGNQIWTYYRLTGISGAKNASATSKGDLIHEVEISGCAQSACNGTFPIVKWISANEVIIAVINGVALAATDANNGAITWEIKRAMLDLRGRGTSAHYLLFMTYENSAAHSAVRITAAPGPGHFPLSNTEWKYNSTVGTYLGKTDYLFELGGIVVPEGKDETAGTWTRVTTTATITATAHGLSPGGTLYVIDSSDIAAIIISSKTIIATPDANTLTFACLDAGAASGTLSFYKSTGIQFTLETVNKFRRPWSPYQVDYQRFYNCTATGYTGPSPFRVRGLLRIANTTQQSRGNEFHTCAVAYADHLIEARRKLPAGRASSIGFECKASSGGGDILTVFYLEQPQAQVVLEYLHIEGYGRLIHLNNPTIDLSNIVVRGGYMLAGGNVLNPPNMDGIVYIENGGAKIAFENVPLNGYYAPFDRGGQMVWAVGAPVHVLFENCQMPSREVFAKNDWQHIFKCNGGYASIEMRGCVELDYGWTYQYGWRSIPDMKFMLGGPLAELSGPLAVQHFGGRGFGLSNNESSTSNFLARVTISGTNTRKAWEFRDPEMDETYSSHAYEVIPIPISATGTPTAGSAVGTVVDKTRRGAVLQVEAAPGGGNSRTFALINVRDRGAAVTAWHPLDEGTLQYWYRAGWDFHYEIPATPYQLDTVAGRKYFRNQCQRRAATTNTPYGDMFNDTANTTPAYSALTFEAGYNNRQVLTTDATDWIYTAHAASFTQPTTPITMYFVGHPIGGSGMRTAFEIYDGVNGLNGVACIKHDGTNLIARCGSSELTYATAWNACQVICAVFDGASSSLYFSAATAVATGTTGTITGGFGGYASAFNSIFTGQAWAGMWAEVIVFTGAHNATQRGNAMGYLGAYYGKSIGA